jgi:tetratricopeptide (TPR) repeat protein
MTPQQRIEYTLALNAAFFSSNWVESRRLSMELSIELEADATFLLMSGITEFNLGNLSAAKLYLKKLTGMEPDNHKSRKMLALIHGNVGEFEEGIACLQNINDDEALLMLGNYYVQVDAYAAAVLALEKVQHNPKAKILLGQACKESGLLQRAEALLLEVMERGSEQAEWATMWLGEVLIQQQRWTDLERIMLSAAKIPQCALASRTVLAEFCLKFDRLDEAARWLPSAEKTNWGHAFSVQAITRLRLLHRQNAVEEFTRAEHPYPDSELGVTCLTLNRSGRFAHQVGDYLCLRFHADPYGIPVETPDWVGHYVFELNDPMPSGKRTSIRCSGSWLENQVKFKGAQAIAGYDIHSVGLLDPIRSEHVVKAREVLRIRDHWKVFFAPMLSSLRARGNTVVCIHMRLTDRSDRTPSIAWYIEWLQSLWVSLENPVLYIASDDLDTAISAFTEFKPVTLSAISTSLPGLEWLQDFYVVMNSDIVAGSAGGFCTLANMLNTTGKLFFRPDLDQQCLVSYSPLLEP